MTGDLCAGVEVQHEKEGYLRTKHVRIHICGTDGNAWFTPDEARALAALLLLHANKCEGKAAP